MQDKVWTEEEREKAADSFSGRMMQTQHIVEEVKLTNGDTVRVLCAGINLECELNEAREILMLAEFTDSEHLTRYYEWLARNTK